jgi:hypothetical protein
MPNNPNAIKNLKPFQKGDKRINRLGRKIRGKDALRREWEAIWSEIMFDENGKPIIDDITGKALTRLKAQMRAMTTSTNIRKVELALAYTYGKPKEEVDLTSGGEALKPKEDNARFDRAISTLADAIREVLLVKGTGKDGKVDTTE